MITYLKNHKVLAICLAVVLAILVILGTTTTVKQINAKKTANAPVQQVTDSTVGTAINSVIPDGKNASTMVAPGTEDWWNAISDFVPAYNLAGMSYSEMPAKPSQLGWTVSYSDEIQSDFNFGLNSVFLTFNSEDDAAKATEWLASTGNNEFQPVTKGKVVVLAPSWSNVNRDLLLKDYTGLQESADVTPDKGYWKVDFATLKEVFVTDATSTVYDKAVTDLGFNTKSEESVWYASSTDGLTWNGYFNEGVWNHENLDAEAFKNDMLATSVDSVDTSNTGIPEGSSGDIQYTTELNQALILDYVAIQTKELGVGFVTDFATGDTTTPEPLKTDDETKLSINPNAWFSVMSGRPDVPVYFNYDLATLTFNNSNTDMNITFSKTS
jgi:hypothetical protein